MTVTQKSKRKLAAPAHSTVIGASHIGGDGKAGKEGDALARHFLKILLEDAGGGSRKKAKKPEFEDEASKLFADLDDTDGDVESEQDVYLSVDMAAAAVRLARAIEPEIGLVKALRKDAPVVLVETGDASVNSEVEKVLKACVLGPKIETVAPHYFDGGRTQLRGPRAVAIFERSSQMGATEAADLSKWVGYALQARYPIIEIAGDVVSQLPKDLNRIADYRIALNPLGASGISLVIGAVTGKTPSTPMDEDFARNCDLSDLRISVHADRGADGSMNKLVEVIKRRQSLTDLDPRLEDLYGYGEAKTIGLGIIADLKAYQEGKISWGAVDRGLLLDGPPGTGKTTYAKALAKSAGLPLVIGSLAQWQAAREGHLGHCLAAMRESFAEAKRKAPCIFLVDELDSFGDRGSFTDHNKDYSTQVVNAFLEALDGAGGRQGVVVIGATNHVGKIDPAITRAGRLDRTVEIPLPDIEALEKIFRFHLKGDLDAIDISPAAVAARGGTGADCEAWVRRARGTARRENRELMLDGLLGAIREGRNALPEHIRERVSVHEAGHAIAALAAGLGEPQSLTIHDWGGSTLFAGEGRAMTGLDIIKAIAQLLAGREAEKLVYGDFTAGAGGGEQSDLAKATMLAAAYEGSFGLGSLGPIWLGEPEQLATPMRLVAFSGKVGEILQHASAAARRAVGENRPALERLAKALCEASYLDGAQIKKVVGVIRKIEIEPLCAKPRAMRADNAGPDDEHMEG